jgi:hypothetical protein
MEQKIVRSDLKKALSLIFGIRDQALRPYGETASRRELL